ncbi:MAG: hypothetical protein AMJ81_06960 [Phycisphaerae bacterium SM23_33]|nr:MAG: hypothetical protein AMJ81_06960 [Phycisphaerae bacterium SM23_33]
MERSNIVPVSRHDSCREALEARAMLAIAHLAAPILAACLPVLERFAGVGSGPPGRSVMLRICGAD